MQERTPDASGLPSALIVGAAVGVLAGTLAVAHGATGFPPRQEPRPSLPPGLYATKAAAGPGLDAGVAAAKVRAGLRGGGVSSVRVLETPSPDQVSASPRVVTTLSTNVGADDQGGGIRATWLGELAEGAVADQVRTNQSSITSVIGGGEVREPSVDGTSTLSIPLGIGNTAGGQSFVAPADATIEARATAVSQKYGLVVKDVTILHPLGTALDVTFTVPDNLHPTWTISSLMRELEGDPMQLDGAMITLESKTEVPLLVESASYRTGGGGLWFADGQDARFGAIHL